MSLAPGQVMILKLAAAFFMLQFLPHHFTRLHAVFSFIYPPLGLLVFAVTVVGAFVTGIMWMSARETESKLVRRNWFATFAVTFAIGIGISIASAAYAGGLPTGSFSKHFDQSLWSDSSSGEYVSGDITPRQKMLGSVVRHIVENGRKQDIIAKLGPSEDDGYFASSGRDLIYCTGPQRDSPMPIDNEWLLIWFDSSGRTSRYEIWLD